MKVAYIKARSFGAVGPDGPIERVFNIGDEVDLPDLHAQVEIATGYARALSGPTDPEPTEPFLPEVPQLPVVNHQPAGTDEDSPPAPDPDAEPVSEVVAAIDAMAKMGDAAAPSITELAPPPATPKAPAKKAAAPRSRSRAAASAATPKAPRSRSRGK